MSAFRYHPDIFTKKQNLICYGGCECKQTCYQTLCFKWKIVFLSAFLLEKKNIYLTLQTSICMVKIRVVMIFLEAKI